MKYIIDAVRADIQGYLFNWRLTPYVSTFFAICMFLKCILVIAFNTLAEAELETDLSVQRKRQEIEEARLENERTLLREQAEIEKERLEAKVNAEAKRKELVALSAENQRTQSEADAYAIEATMRAYRELPVENLKAMALAKMDSQQLMAMAFETLALNSGKIGELNITPDLFSQFMKKGSK